MPLDPSNSMIFLTGVQDLDGDGLITLPPGATGANAPKYYMSMTSMPSVGIDASNTIYLSYCSFYDGSDNGADQGYQNVHVMKSSDGGTTWIGPLNIVNDPYLETVFPSLARRVDANLHIVYQRDDQPGLAARGDLDPYTTNDIVYARVDVNEIVGLQDRTKPEISVRNYPNPFRDETTIELALGKSSRVQVSVYNTVGQQVLEMNPGQLSAGRHSLKLNGTALNAGIYFYTVKIGNEAITGKMVIE